MLLQYGYEKVKKSWNVIEEEACGYVRIYYMQGGDAFYESATECKKLKKDMLYCFPSKVPYKITQNPENCVECLFLHANIAPCVISVLREIDVSEHIPLKKILEIFRILCEDETVIFGGAFQQQLMAAMIEYLKKINLLEMVDAKIEKSVLYMMKNIDQTIKIEEMSKYCGYHPQYFIRLFRECMGLTPHQFIINYRMKNALVMLQTGVPVSKTAEMVGYKESKIFSRAFKQFYGISPSKVKKYFNSMI